MTLFVYINFVFLFVSDKVLLKIHNNENQKQTDILRVILFENKNFSTQDATC